MKTASQRGDAEGDLRSPQTGGLPGERRGRRKTLWLIAAAVVLVAAGVSVAIVNPFASGGSSRPGVAGNADPTSLATVARQDLSSQTQVSATLGYAGSYPVVNQAAGTVTAVPAVGQVVSQDQVLYQVSGLPHPVVWHKRPRHQRAQR